MSTRISACGYCHKTEFTSWYSQSAPRNRHGVIDRDFLDSQPVAYCSEEHRDAADAERNKVLTEAADAIVAKNDRILWATTPGKHWAADLVRSLIGEKDTAPAAASTPTEQVIYRAEYEHESIPLGLYTTLAAARAHCEGQLRSEYPATVAIVFDWIGDEDDPEQPWELVAEIDGGAEQLTGYVVTPLTVAAEYDPEAEG